MKTHKSYYFLLLFLFFPWMELIAGWNSFIINFDKSIYGKGAQTWQIAPYDDRWIYFANKNGMMQFDGNVWTTFPMNNALDVRSVFLSASQKRIYAGGINEFGYYEPAENGALVYHCISDTLDGAIRYLGNVWGIHEADNILYFQGDGRVVKCLDDKYTVIRMDAKIDCSNMVNGTLYIGTDKGVWVLVGNSFFPLPGGDKLTSMRIRGIIPYKDGILVVTAYDGLFYCNGTTVEPFLTGAEDFMRKNEVFCVAEQGDKIALGTIHRGILVIDCTTRQLNYFNENNGLHNNTVLSVSFDMKGNLWAGLDNGIDYICLRSPFTNLYTYPYSYGTGYAAAVDNGYLYLGTNRGLYYTPYPVKPDGNQPDIRSVSHSSGQVWNICRVGDELFCLHDRGVFLIQGTSVSRITDIVGAWACQQVIGHTDLMYVGVYDGLYLVAKQTGSWQVVCKVEGVDDSCRIFEQENDRVIWMYNTVNDVIRLELAPDLTKVVDLRKFRVGDNVPGKNNVSVAKVGGRICFVTSGGIYEYNPHTDAIEPASDINDLLNGRAYLRLQEYNGKLIALGTNEIGCFHLNTYRRGGVGANIVPIHPPLPEQVSTFETVIPLSDSLMILPNEKGFALFAVPSVSEQRSPMNSLYIRNMYLSYPQDSLVYTANFLKQKQVPVISYSLNSVRFDYGLSFPIDGDDVRFRYRLNNRPWSDYTSVYTKEIAPLLNLSVRGVETIRYRLRKKFGLERREDSLNDYLDNKI